MSDTLLTFNAGSSTVKIGLFEIAGAEAKRLARAVIDFRHEPPTLKLTEGPRQMDVRLRADADDLNAVVSETFEELAKDFDFSRISCVGHRVVHGGDRFDGPTVLDDATITQIEALTPLAPLHQPQALRLIHAIRNVYGDMGQAASFDTAFHRTNAEIVRRFALPRQLFDEGIKKYGFHGLSYKYIAGALHAIDPVLAKRKVITAHLGSGASLCAMEGGQSRDTSMGFSTLDGIPMATRCGALDPGVLLHLLGAKNQTLKDIEDMLYHRSGLLGVSGISADSRELLESDAPEAAEAIMLFAHRISGEIARLAGTLQGLDAIVFTAGIGENQPKIREDVCARLGWLGVELDPAANAANAGTISSAASRIRVLVIPTDEEQVIADETLRLINRESQ